MKTSTKKSVIINLIFTCMSFLLVLGAALLWHRNQITSLEYFLPMILTLALLALLFLTALFWSLEARMRLMLISGSVLGALFIAEFSLSLMGISNPHNGKIYRERMAKRAGISFDHRNKYEVVADLQKTNKNAWPNIGPQYFVATNGLHLDNQILFPVGGIANSLVVVCNESGKFSTYHSDEHGFNNPHGLYQNAPIDILIIGDSFAHGACVEPGQDVASLLRKYGFAKTITLGSNGIGPLIELASLSEYGPTLKPKTVLWFYFEGNDLPDLKVESQSSFLYHYFNEGFSQNLFNNQHNIDETLRQYVEAEKTNLAAQYESLLPKTTLSSLIKLRTLRSQLLLNKLRKEPFMSPIGLFESILVTAQKRVNQWGGELVFVYLPEHQRFNTKRTVAFDQSRHKAEVLKIVNSLGIKIIDISDKFAHSNDPLSLFPLRIDGHYTPEGYKLVANEIKNHIETNQPLTISRNM